MRRRDPAASVLDFSAACVDKKKKKSGVLDSWGTCEWWLPPTHRLSLFAGMRKQRRICDIDYKAINSWVAQSHHCAVPQAPAHHFFFIFFFFNLGCVFILYKSRHLQRYVVLLSQHCTESSPPFSFSGHCNCDWCINTLQFKTVQKSITNFSVGFNYVLGFAVLYCVAVTVLVFLSFLRFSRSTSQIAVICAELVCSARW